MKLSIKSTCVGCMQCVALAPDLFYDAGGFAKVRSEKEIDDYPKSYETFCNYGNIIVEGGQDETTRIPNV